VVKAFLSHTPQETFADRIGSWCMNGRFKNLDGTRCRHPSKTWSKFTIMIANQILPGSRKPRSGLRDCAQRLPTSGLLAGECELASCTSEWFACRHACRVSIIPRESSQHRRRRFSFAISLINAMVSAATLGLCEEASDLRFQYRRKSPRCHRSSVSG
jgi:hypothetical protein